VLAEDDGDADVATTVVNDEIGGNGETRVTDESSRRRRSRNHASMTVFNTPSRCRRRAHCDRPANAADRAAREWLERMSESLATRNYDGRYLHVRNARTPETMRIIHRVEKGKVTRAPGIARRQRPGIIRNQDEVICYLPDRRMVLTVEKRTDDARCMATVPLYNEQLEDHYSIERGPFNKALGRRTQVIMVQPRDEFRYGYRLWLDDETAMPLMSQLCDRNGNVIEQILFAELNFRDRIRCRR
jgi:sigma-E factor negative regulatory protein RseB